MPPYDQIPVSHAIRASCSIPGITTPYSFVDHARGGRTYDLALDYYFTGDTRFAAHAAQ